MRGSNIPPIEQRGGARNAHWADGATLDLLRLVVRRIESLPVLLIVSYRHDELGANHPLAVMLGDVATCAAVTRIGLAPLSAEAVAVLAAGSGVNAAELHRLTGGNAFFVTEILAGGPDAVGADGLPRSVSEAACGRLARLSAVAAPLRRACAWCCRPVACAALASASACAARALAAVSSASASHCPTRGTVRWLCRRPPTSRPVNGCTSLIHRHPRRDGMKHGGGSIG
jgi:hypothetical protein